MIVCGNVLNNKTIPGWPLSGRNKIPWLFPDQIQFFPDQNTAVLQPICVLAADKWQIPFTSSLKCTSLILQMKQIKSLNSLLAQNVLKLTSFHSFERAKRAREKINFSSSQNTCYNTYFGPKLWNSLTFSWLSWYLKFPWPICKIPLLFHDLEEKSNFPDFSLTSGHPVFLFPGYLYPYMIIAGIIVLFPGYLCRKQQ